jgi:hypothetical protein
LSYFAGRFSYVVEGIRAFDERAASSAYVVHRRMNVRWCPASPSERGEFAERRERRRVSSC